MVGASYSTDAPGVTHDGAYAEYIVVTADLLVKLPGGTDWGQAAAATDAGVTSYTGVVVHGGVKAGDRVGIIGLGGLGMTGARIAVLQGATVYGVEPKESSWETAREQGVAEMFKRRGGARRSRPPAPEGRRRARGRAASPGDRR